MSTQFLVTNVLPFFTTAAAVVGAISASVAAWRFGSIQAGIAKQQARTAHNKLRLDLFERRLKVYQAVADYLAEVPMWVPEESKLDDHLPKFTAARWLFGDEVAN